MNLPSIGQPVTIVFISWCPLRSVWGRVTNHVGNNAFAMCPYSERLDILVVSADREGIDWIRGAHGKNSPEARALVARKILDASR